MAKGQLAVGSEKLSLETSGQPIILWVESSQHSTGPGAFLAASDYDASGSDEQVCSSRNKGWHKEFS